ncbi:MAG: hypothetical protein M3Z66_16835 [Chloroflexota bacterium]|nr:hypothetical protein [Chloroflexota bacterium]
MTFGEELSNLPEINSLSSAIRLSSLSHGMTATDVYDYDRTAISKLLA